MLGKIFHPTMEASAARELDENMLMVCAGVLHDLGWMTQQGMFDAAVERLRWLAENKQEAFLKACSTGLAACLDAKR